VQHLLDISVNTPEILSISVLKSIDFNVHFVNKMGKWPEK